MKYLPYLLITCFICVVVFIMVMIYKSSNTFTQKTNNSFSNIKEYTYNEHDYIKFSEGYRCGVVHDPDCKKCKSLQYQMADTVFIQ